MTTYLLLVITARAVGPKTYGEFSFFWAAMIVISLGLFLPIEQAVARRVAQSADHGAAGRLLLRQGVLVATIVGAVISLVLSIYWPSQRGSSSTEVLLLLALLISVMGFVVQFPARGVLAATMNFRDYGTVVSIDAGLRVLIALALWFRDARSAVPFAIAVGSSALACGSVGQVLARHRLPASSSAMAPAEPVVGLGRESARLISAAVCMQLLLNSGVLIAVSATSTRDSVFAGHLLAVLTIARLPVFLFQSVQASYLSKIAFRYHTGDDAGLRRMLVRLVRAVAAVAGVTLSGAAFAGPQAIRLIFGPSYEIGRGAATLVAFGVSVYLAAAVANDVAVATGAHTLVGGAWVAGIVAATVVVVSVDDLLLRSTLPLIVGAAVAGCVLASPVIRSIRWKVEL